MFRDYHGKIKGFGELPIGRHYVDRPFGMADFHEVSRSSLELPDWAPSWWRIVALEPPPRRQGSDPYAIYDRWGNLLHLWNQVDPPSYADVIQVCNQLLRR